MWKNIVNPKTGRKVNVNSKIGKSVLRNYIKQLGGATAPGANIAGTPKVPRQLHFYDNNLNNSIDNALCPRIRFNWVVATGNFYNDGIKDFTFPFSFDAGQYDDEFLLLFDEGSNARRLANYIKESLPESNLAYDIRAGKNVIIDKQLQSFYDHVIYATSNVNVDGFVFDWDRTLQVTEGMFNLNVEDWTETLGEGEGGARRALGKAETIDTLGEYHADGNERREQLRAMFSAIGDKPVTIISENPEIEGRGKDVYIAILENWGCKNINAMHYSTTTTKYQTMSRIMNQYC